jgi:hypothetical protein
MITQTKSPGRPILVAALLVLTAVAAFAQTEWGDIIKSSQPVTVDDWGGVGYGEVAEGFASFALDLNTTGPLTIEVVVTEERPGRLYEDDDSMLWFYDSEGNLLSENDDGPYGTYASLINGVEIMYPGRYYVIVTTHPNRPESDSNGQFIELLDEGGSNISFELFVEWGFREIEDYGYGYDDPYSGGGETAIWFEDFRNLASPIRYDGGEYRTQGTVGDGVTLYSLTSTESASISVEASAAGYGDTVLFLIDSDGNLIAEDDDGAGDGGSLIFEAYVDRSEEYFVAVTTFPNWPNYDESGSVEGFPLGGQEFIEFELVIGPPQEFSGYEEYYGNSETVVWFDDFQSLATPLRYTGGEMTADGSVSSDVAVYYLTLTEPMPVSLEVATYSEYGDSVLYVFDDEGYLLAENDDGGMGGGSLIPAISLDQTGGYYLTVVPFGSYPNIDEWGYLEGFPESNGEYLAFDLVIGPPRDDYGYVPYDDSFRGEPYPDEGIGANSIDEVAHFAAYLPITNGTGIGSGEVGVGYSAFEFEINSPLYVTIEVVVTEVRQGVSYADSDSMLAVFGADGQFYAEDDDGGDEGASKIEGLWIEQPGTYFAIVTTFPNSPATDRGAFPFIEAAGGSNIGFDLIVNTDFAAQ